MQYQYPELTILSHVSCFTQGNVIGFQVLLDIQAARQLDKTNTQEHMVAI